MGNPADTALPPITPEDYENMKRRVWIKWEPELRKLARERAAHELAAKAARAIGGFMPPADDMFEHRLRKIHRAIAREIDALPKPAGVPEKKRSPAVLDKLPSSVRRYLKNSLDREGLKLTDDATLKWMGDVVSNPHDRLPTVYGAGVEFPW